MNASFDTNEALASDDGHAIEWLQYHLHINGSLSPLGRRWLARAIMHLDTRLDRFIRGTEPTR